MTPRLFSSVRAWIMAGGCFGLAAFAGCVAHPPPAPAAPLQAGYLMAGRSCSGMQALSVSPLNFDQKRIIKFDRASPCIVAKAGVNEPVALLALPAAASTYYVTVRVWRGHQVLVPRLALLDARRKVMLTLTHADMKRTGGTLTVTFFVNPKNAGPAYLLLYPDPTLTGDRHAKLKQGATMGYYGFFDVLSGTAKSSTVVFAERGTLEVEAHRYGSAEPGATPL